MAGAKGSLASLDEMLGNEDRGRLIAETETKAATECGNSLAEPLAQD